MNEKRIAEIEAKLSELVSAYAEETDLYIAGHISSQELDKITAKFVDDTKVLLDELAAIQHERRNS